MVKLKVLYISNNGGGAPMSLLNMIHSLREWVEPTVLFPENSGLYERFCNEGIKCLVLPFQQEIYTRDTFGSLSTINKIRFLRNRAKYYLLQNRTLPQRLREALGDTHFDIVHTNTGAIDVGIRIAKAFGAKHVWHLREFQDLDYNSRPMRGWWLFNMHLRQSDAVIAITQAIYNHFNLEKHANSHVVWNAVRQIPDASMIRKKERYILFAANVFVEGKGLHDLLNAYSQSILPKNNIKLKIAGNKTTSEYSDQLITSVEDYGISESVDWLGHVDVCPFMERALCFVMPSLNEALGRVAIEAMFYGCPVIARNSGGPSEYIKHGVNGYLFNGVDDLVQLLNTIPVTNQDNVIETSQQFAKENFSEECFGEKIYSIYQSLIE